VPTQEPTPSDHFLAVAPPACLRHSSSCAVRDRPPSPLLPPALGRGGSGGAAYLAVNYREVRRKPV